MGLAELVQQLPQLIGSAVDANPWLGYGAIFAAMFLENLFPPIPSELIMPLGGFYVQQGQLALVPVVLAAESSLPEQATSPSPRTNGSRMERVI